MHKHKLSSMAFVAVLATIATVVTALSAFGAPKPDITFVTPPRTTAAGVASETITVALPSGYTGPAEVKLKTSSGSGVFRNTADTATIGITTIPSGQGQASFRYRDTVAGKPTLTVTAMSTAAKKQWSGNLSASQTETVVPAALDRMTLAPSTASVASGVNQTYTASGFDKYNNSRGNVTAGTTFSIAPDGSCSGATCSAQAAGTHTVTATNGSVTAKATLNVTPGPVTKIVVSPQLATIGSGGTQAYSVEGFDAAGNDAGSLTSKASFGIAPDGSCEGAVCTANHRGSHSVTASFGSLSDQATLEVESDPETTVSLTFDDGRADQMQAAQILGEHGMAGTFFVISGRIGAAGYMTLPNLEELATAGNEIGGHTVNHLNLLTVNRAEAERQVCNGRVQLESWGFDVWNFAYPQGGADAELEEVVESCNFNSARGVSDLVSPGACSGCAYAETIPPQRPYKIRTPDSIKATTSLDDLKGLVRQAQEHDGGWVPLVFHHVCEEECDAASIDPETLDAFLGWLAAEEGNGVSVKTVHEVIGGEHKPLVAGPAAPVRTGELIENPSLEADEGSSSVPANGVPDCWTIGTTGVNSFEAARTADSHSGSFAERIAISSFESGDKRLITTQDLGQCAPAASPTHTYTASAFYKGEGTMRWVGYLRNGQGGWSFWAQSPPLAPSSEYAATSWKTPQVPSWATAISVGISLRSVGSFTADDFHLQDNGEADQSPPSVSITAPEGGTTVEGTTPIDADATDNVGVVSVRFFLDGVSLGSKTSPTAPGGSSYRWNWDTTAASVGTHTLTAVASDDDGNQTTSVPVTVEVVRDTTAPTTSIQCNGSSTCSGWLKSPVSVSLKATDNLAVAGTYYTTDGSEPSAVNGTLYTGPFSLTSTTEVKYRSVDSEGNWESTHSQLIQVDGQAPTSVLTAPVDGATVTRTSTVAILDEATDDVSIASVRFYLDGVSLGSKTAPTVAGGSTYRWNWDTTGVSEGQHTLNATVTDAAGNQTASGPVTVTVVPDSTAPSTSILCNGSSTCGNWFKAAVSVTLKATDDVAVAATYYTTDGSEPSAVNGTLYSGAFSVGATSEVKYRSVDPSGNLETAHAQLIQVDTQAPATKITSPAGGATVTGITPILAEATDNVSIVSVRFFLDGVSLGSKAAPTVAGGSTYRWNWETTATSKGAHTLTVVATDQAGGQTTSAPISVTVG
jgi:peptidoglycan/xylan/chitin deacetylase (PgdA/CDA1 family)